MAQEEGVGVQEAMRQVRPKGREGQVRRAKGKARSMRGKEKGKTGHEIKVETKCKAR